MTTPKKLIVLMEQSQNNGYIVTVSPARNENEFEDFMTNQLMPLVEKLQRMEDNDPSEDWKRLAHNDIERIEREINRDVARKYIGKYAFTGDSALAKATDFINEVYLYSSNH